MIKHRSPYLTNVVGNGDGKPIVAIALDDARNQDTVHVAGTISDREKYILRFRVEEVAEAKGFNMSSLSRASDVSFNTIKRIFRDPYREITTTTLHKIAKALGVPIGFLIEEISE